MAKFKSHDTFAFIALFTVIAYITVPVQTNTMEHHTPTNVTDNRVPIRQRNRGRGNPQRGRVRGGLGDRPLNHGHGLLPPGSPSATTISVAQGASSSNDITLYTFLKVLIFAFHCISVVLAHVKHDGCGLNLQTKINHTETLRVKAKPPTPQHSPSLTLPSGDDTSNSYFCKRKNLQKY